MHNGCVLWGGVGTGKTITALSYALEKEPGKKIVVVTTAKKRTDLDWMKEAAKMWIPVDNIEVTSWNKIQDLVEYKNCMFIFDEQRLVGAGAWVKAFYKIARKNRWILLSATPGDTWSDYAPMFIANGYYKNITELRREHAVYSRFTKYPKIERWINEGKLQKFRKMLLVEMPMIRHTTRHMHYLECNYDSELLDIVRKKRWNVYEDRPIENAAELFGVMRKVVSSDPDRVTAMEDLATIHPRLIVFYNYNYELEILRDLCSQLETKSSTSSWPNATEIEAASQRIASRQNVQGPMTPKNNSADVRPVATSLPVEKDSGDLYQVLSAASPEDLNSSDRQSFESTLPPWYLSDSEMETAFQTWMQTRITNKEESEQWESTTSRTSPETSSPASPPPSESWTELDGSPTTPRILSSSDEPPLEARPRTPEIVTGRTASPATTTTTSRETSPLPRSDFRWAEWNGHKHQPVPDSDRWIYLVQYSSGSEGWECTQTDAMAFWSLTYSWKQYWQAQGRTDRMNTPFEDLMYYIFLTNSMAEKPVIRSLEAKHDFQPR